MDQLHETRRERMAARKEERARIQQLSQDLERSLARADADAKEIRAIHDALSALRAERRRERRADLRRQFGAAVAEPEVRAELELHARRTARLKRMQFLAATEHTGKKRAALLARIQDMFGKEGSRHDQAMQRLVPNRPRSDAPPSAAASAAPARPAASGGKP